MDGTWVLQIFLLEGGVGIGFTVYMDGADGWLGGGFYIFNGVMGKRVKGVSMFYIGMSTLR